MLYRTNTLMVRGLSVLKVKVEVSIHDRGMPYFDIIGLGGRSLIESKLRIKTAFSNSNYKFPDKKITVNLVPADEPKEGSYFDLPISICILADILKIKLPDNILSFGEVMLNGELKNTKGAFLFGLFTFESGKDVLICPTQSKHIVRYFKNIKSVYCSNLEELARILRVQFYSKNEAGGPISRRALKIDIPDKKEDYSKSRSLSDEIIGQESAKRALQISSAGGHNLMFIGPPGTGKTMLAKSAIDLLPDLSESEFIEVNKIHSIYKLNKEGQEEVSMIITDRPFRNPHHTISYSGLLGGGLVPAPGELSLAHTGILFLDELAEFNRRVIESLRQPLEEGVVRITRSKGSYLFPAKFILICATNPCPCGYYSFDDSKCECSLSQIASYRQKLIGPLTDRIDLCVRVSKPSKISIENYANTTRTEVISNHTNLNYRKITSDIWNLQKVRFLSYDQGTNGYFGQRKLNSHMSNSEVKRFCSLNTRLNSVLISYIENNNLSMRSYFKILKVSRTIADLDSKSEIGEEHLMEAFIYKTQL